LQASRPWEAPRDGYRVEPPPGGVAPDLARPSTEPVPAYRPSGRGGLVNRDGPSYRDPTVSGPIGDRTAARPSYNAGGGLPGRNEWPTAYPDTGAAPVGPYPGWNRNAAPPGPAPATGYGYQNDPNSTGYPPPVYPSTDRMPNGNVMPAAGLDPYPPSVDPSAARLDGVIEKPTARTFNEYPRSSFR